MFWNIDAQDKKQELHEGVVYRLSDPYIYYV